MIEHSSWNEREISCIATPSTTSWSPSLSEGGSLCSQSIKITPSGRKGPTGVYLRNVPYSKFRTALYLEEQTSQKQNCPCRTMRDRGTNLVLSLIQSPPSGREGPTGVYLIIAPYSKFRTALYLENEIKQTKLRLPHNAR